MSAQQKRDQSWRVLRSLYAQRAPAAVLRRAERLHHRLSNLAFAAQPTGTAA